MSAGRHRVAFRAIAADAEHDLITTNPDDLAHRHTDHHSDTDFSDSDSDADTGVDPSSSDHAGHLVLLDPHHDPSTAHLADQPNSDHTNRDPHQQRPHQQRPDHDHDSEQDQRGSHGFEHDEFEHGESDGDAHGQDESDVDDWDEWDDGVDARRDHPDVWDDDLLDDNDQADPAWDNDTWDDVEDDGWNDPDAAGIDDRDPGGPLGSPRVESPR